MQELALEDIVVTANRREQNLQDVPIAITAVNGEALDRAGVTDTADLPTVAAGLVWVQARGASTPFLRGVGTLNNGPQAEAPTALYIDGIYLPGQNAGLQSLVSVERIEVLKGPQGTLFGRNATGGLINIITRDPTGEAHLEAEAGYGNYGTATAKFYGSGGLATDLAADVSLDYVHQSDGYGFNPTIGREVNRREAFTGRTKLLWTPGDRTRVTIAGDYWNRSGDEGRIFNIWRGSLGRDGKPYGTLLGIQDTASEISMEDNGATGGGLSVKVEQELGSVRLVSISSVRRTNSHELYDPDYTPLKVVVFDVNSREDVISQEIQLLSNEASRIKWIVGAFLFDRDLDRTSTDSGISFNGLGGGRFRRLSADTKSLAGFGQATFPLFSAATNLTLGARYTSDKLSFSGAQQNFNANAFVAAADERQTNNELTYRAIVDHHLDPDTMIYASINRGYVAGQIPGFGAARSRPEFLDAFELGLKSTLLDRRLRLNVTGFYYDYKDLQIEVVNPINVIDSINAPSAEIYGVELEATAAVTNRFGLRTNVAYVHSAYGAFQNAPFFVPLPTGANAQIIGNATGNQLIGSPRWSANMTGDYRVPLAREGEVTFSATLSYNSRIFWDPQNRVDSSPRTLLNGQVRWVMPGGRWYAQVWGRNITDVEYYALGSPSAALGDRARAGDPRTYGVGVGVRF